MGALPIYENVAERYEAYIAELREFFSTYSLYYGSPDDLLPVNALLHTPGPFPGDFSLVLRSLFFRERKSLSRSQLLEIVAVAIGGPDMEHPPKECWKQLNQLFGFISSVRRKPMKLTPGGAQLIPFPSSVLAEEGRDSTSGMSYPEAAPPSIARFFERIVPSPFPPWLSAVLIAAAGALLIGAFLVFVLQPNSHSQIHQRSLPAPAVYHPKPTPYGEAFLPALRAPLRTGIHHRPAPAPPEAEQAEALPASNSPDQSRTGLSEHTAATDAVPTSNNAGSGKSLAPAHSAASSENSSAENNSSVH